MSEVQTTIRKMRASYYRRSLHDFVRAAWYAVEQDEFIDNWHIGVICEHLEAVKKGSISKIVVNIPPGTMKSLLHCVFFPAWVWADDPTRRFFYASYDATLALRDSSKCRLLLDSEWYKLHFPGQVEFTRDQNQKGRYQNTAGGYRLATSVGGHGLGEHPHFIIADDPNNSKEIESQKARQEVELWWTQTIATRGLTVDSRRIVVQQRLHARDLSGVCLDEGGYDHLCLEMRCEKPGRSKTALGFVDKREEGELLAKDLIGEAVLKPLEKTLGPYGVAGQMQQRPVPRTGGLFDVSKLLLNKVPVAPTDLSHYVRAWDTGASSKGDYTAGVKIAKQETTGRFYILHVKRGQWKTDERMQIQRATAVSDREDIKEISCMQIHKGEPGSGGKDQGENFIKLMSGFPCMTKRDTGPKEVRADPFSCQVNAGNVYMVDGDWNQEFVEELRVAPNGANDDQWDAAATAFNWIELQPHIPLMPEGWTFGDEAVSENADEQKDLMLEYLELNRID